MQRHPDAKRFGQLDLHVFQRLDGRDGKLGRRVLFSAQHAADQHRNIDLQLLGQLLVGLRKGDQVDLADRIFERGLRVHLAGALRLRHLQAGDHAGDLRSRSAARCSPPRRKTCGSGFISQRGRGVDDLQVAELLAVLVQRVAGDEEAEHLLLVLQARVLIPVRSVGQGVVARGRSAVESRRRRSPKRPCWPAAASRCDFCARSIALSSAAMSCERLPKAVQRAGLDERFEDALVHAGADRLFRRTPRGWRSRASLLPAAPRAPRGSTRWRCGRRS